MNIMNLDENVIKALDFFIKNKTPKLNLKKFKMPLVVGSGNAYNTGTIIFSEHAAIFADESTFKSVIKSYSPVIKNKLIKQAIVISASGEKDSVWEVELAKKYGLKTTLLTCVGTSSAAKIADENLIYRKIAEPYTYNTSTYLGMILSATGEDPKQILNLIKKIKLPKDFKKFKSYTFVLPDKFINICPMIDIKKSELFGSRLSLRAFSEGHARHAKFVIPDENEMVVSLGYDNEYFGIPKNRWNIKLPESASFGLILSLSYYLVGKIQASKPPYFKKNIEAYCKDHGPKAYGRNKPFDVIVPDK